MADVELQAGRLKKLLRFLYRKLVLRSTLHFFRPVDELFGEILYSLTEILRDICTEENGSYVE